jgi:hypothetical protein
VRRCGTTRQRRARKRSRATRATCPRSASTELPVIVSASEDGAVKLWHSTTYRLEQTSNHGMARVWAVGIVRGSNAIALGYDNGLVVLELGDEEHLQD